MTDMYSMILTVLLARNARVIVFVLITQLIIKYRNSNQTVDSMVELGVNGEAREWTNMTELHMKV